MKLFFFAFFLILIALITQSDQCKKKTRRQEISFERGYAYDDHKLDVFLENGAKVNYKKDISSVWDCINLCRGHRECQWWNYDFLQKECLLNAKKGDRKIDVKYINMYTGHRDSTNKCGENWSWMHVLMNRPNNPCPNGRITTNCYGDTGRCVRCCTGGQDGSDGTKACIH